VAGVTLQTIADKVGVSRMTVSNAFSRPNQLSPALREKIFAVADSLGYNGPDPAARALKRGSTGAFGLLIPSSLPFAFQTQVRTEFLSAVAAELASTGLAMTLLPSTDDDAGTAEVVPARDVAVDGVIVYGCPPGSEAVKCVRARGIPLVYVDQEPDEQIPSVNLDNYRGAYAAASHLTDLGHRDVGLVTFRTDARSLPRYTESERERGWKDALAAAGVTPTEATVVGDSSDQGLEAVRRLLEQSPELTAVLCYSDLIAESVYAAAAAIGRRIPFDLSVVGFDDSPTARLLSPPLTTVHQDVFAKGTFAVKAMTTAVRRQRSSGGDKHVILPAPLVVRGSTSARHSVKRRSSS
jgi:DNA-binding LacI/PurR family transcriptional regulator